MTSANLNTDFQPLQLHNLHIVVHYDGRLAQQRSAVVHLVFSITIRSRFFMSEISIAISPSVSSKIGRVPVGQLRINETFNLVFYYN